MKRIIVTSDIHGNKVLWENLILESVKNKVDGIFILGDIAPTNMRILCPHYGAEKDVEGESKFQVSWIKEQVEWARKQTQVPIYYLSGNHDFFTKEEVLPYLIHLDEIKDEYNFETYELIPEFYSGYVHMIRHESGVRLTATGFWNNESSIEELINKVSSLKLRPIVFSHNNNANVKNAKIKDIFFEEFYKKAEVKQVFGGHIHPKDILEGSLNEKVISVANDYNSKDLNFKIINLK